ncbi:N-acetylglucosamine-6-phosphate deacetylase [Euzebyella marina]|uniref:N-acetylglucosamine-6-phosphate deacetylase n=1 Tax=Euzebyella marina TaxID=1761453 RepID=A0A3G2LAF6_9FLAO|nr:amidohydrolase family protein [Euzebyella marina]AYN69238.1 N-acetylglucosamine-6-phosphate deacetylase [Euzebyella marina]
MVIEASHYKTGDSYKIHLKDGSVTQVSMGKPTQSDLIISPGLIDLQVNGFKGVDFNSDDLTEAQVVKVIHELWKEGVTSFMPTLITNADINIENAIDCIRKTCESNPLVQQSIAGIHLEGPFLSKEDGPRGAHPKEHLKNPDWQLFKKWQERASGLIKIITLAPELPGSAAFIKKCSQSGVVVSMGHTAAQAEHIAEATTAGARMSTHLGNAAHLNLPRHPNYIWEQLASDDLWISIIADGFHLPDSVLKVFSRVKPLKSILVSDCTKFAGLSPGIYNSHIGGDVELNESGRLFMKNTPELLAGSAQSLLWCVNHMFKSGITTLVNAIEMASCSPKQLLYDQPISSELGENTDLVIFEKISGGGLKVKSTIKSGQLVFTQ